MPDYSTPNRLPAASEPESPLHDARERAVRLLTDGFAYDVITVDEFEWRLGHLGRAESRQEIDALVADLATPATAASPCLFGHGVVPSGCTIDVTAIMANVQFIVPPGMVVDFDVGAIMASTRNDPRAAGRDPFGVPHVRIRGAALMAEVRVKVREAGR